MRFPLSYHRIRSIQIILRDSFQMMLLKNSATSVPVKLSILFPNPCKVPVGFFAINASMQSQVTIQNGLNILIHLYIKTVNSTFLKENVINIQKEVNQTTINITAIKKANEDIIATINEVLRIQKEAKSIRETSEHELAIIENNLKHALLNISK